MGSARNLYRLHLAVGAVAVAVVGFAFVVTVRGLALTTPALDEFVAQCQQALVSGFDVDRVALLALGGLSGLVAVRVARSAARQLHATSCFLRTLRVIDGRTDSDAVRVVDDTRLLVFCAGYLHPRVYVSTATLALLSKEQLEAVLAHEAHHARRRDPLRLLVAQTIADGVFFVPVLRRSRERYSALAEVAADEAAVRASGARAPLAAALMAFETHGGHASGVAPERVDSLAGKRSRWDLPLPALAGGLLTVGALGAAVTVIALTTTAGGFTIASVAVSSCSIALVALPLLAVVATARLLRPRRN